MKIKSLFLFSFVIFNTVSAFAQTDPVIMTINGKPILRSEFEYIYNKNNTNNAIDKKTLDEYVDLFVNFKLKVEEAQAQGLDTTTAFKTELAGYRSQLAKPYLVDNDAEEAVLQEAYNRMKQDVNVSHILIRMSQNPTPADTLASYKRALEIIKRLQKENFEKVARETSEDQSVEKNGGHIGWITAFGTIYPFETAAYNLPVGKISAPVRTALGYHIIKVNDRRPSPGEALTAHIMKFTKEGDDNLNTQSKHTIDSLYQRVLAGDDFGELAQKYSDDKGTATRNGELQWFGTGRMVPEYEAASFALKNKGDVSEPVKSDFGWHIIKLLDKKPLQTYEEAKPQIERMVKRDERANRGQESFVLKLHAKYNPTLYTENLKDYYSVLNSEQPFDSVFFSKVEGFNKPLVTLGEKTLTQKDFNSYLSDNNITAKVTEKEAIDEKFDQFLDKNLLDYEDSQLENQYTDFRNLIREYHDGILLFEVSSREVWDKASKDTLGLTKFFNENKSNYTWQKNHFKGTIVYCKDKATQKKANSIIKKAKGQPFEKTLLQTLNDSVQYVKVQKGLFAEGDNKEADKQIFKKKESYEADKDYPYVLVVGKNLGLEPEEYTDVRGLVTADYQDYLEKEWIKSLREKYPVVIDQNILKTVKKN